MEALTIEQRGRGPPRRRWLRLRLPPLPGLGLAAAAGAAVRHMAVPAAPKQQQRRDEPLGSGGAAAPTASMTAALATSSSSGAAASAAASATPPPATAAAKVPIKPASDVLAGALARAASQSTIHPLDTLKVRMQTRAHVGAGSASSAAAAAGASSLSKFGRLVPPPGGAAATAGAAGELRALGVGVASLYRGVLGAASGAGVAIGAYFAFYSASCNLLSTRTRLQPGAVAFFAGAAAAAGSSVVKVPLAVCIRSVQAGVYPNVFAAARSIVAAAGPRGLFTGYVPTLLEDVPDMAFKFAAYESMRGVHSRMVGGRVASPQEDFAMGAVAGAVAAAATTPLDVVKTRMMCAAAARPTMRGAVRAVLDAGGPRALFTGVGARALSNGINSAVFFCFFEAIRTAFSARAAEKAALLQQQGRLLSAAGGNGVAFDGERSARRAAVLQVRPLEFSDDDVGVGGRAAANKPTLLITLQALGGSSDAPSCTVTEE